MTRCHVSKSHYTDVPLVSKGVLVRVRPNIARWRWKYVPKNVRVYVSRERYALLWVSKLGYVYACATGRFNSPDGDHQRAQVMERIWEGPVKRRDLSMMAGVSLHADPTGLAGVYPHLAEFMTAGAFESDGKFDRREPPTVTFWCQAGQWRASVKDRSQGLVLWLSDSSLQGLLDLLELFVLEESAPWRHDEGERQGKRLK